MQREARIQNNVEINGPRLQFHPVRDFPWLVEQAFTLSPECQRARDRHILWRRFALDGGPVTPVSELARKHRIPHWQVRQICQAIVERLAELVQQLPASRMSGRNGQCAWTQLQMDLTSSGVDMGIKQFQRIVQATFGSPINSRWLGLFAAVAEGDSASTAWAETPVRAVDARRLGASRGRGPVSPRYDLDLTAGHSGHGAAAINENVNCIIDTVPDDGQNQTRCWNIAPAACSGGTQPQVERARGIHA